MEATNKETSNPNTMKPTKPRLNRQCQMRFPFLAPLPFRRWAAHLLHRSSFATRPLSLALLLLLAAHPRLSAQPADDSNAGAAALNLGGMTGGGSLAARALANQVNDPTAPMTFIQFRDVFAPSVPGYNSPGNLLEIEPCFPIFPSPLLPFEQLVKMTLPIPTSPNPDSHTGLGDLALFDLATFKLPWGKWGLGPVFVFPTAAPETLGQGKWQAGPAAALIYTGIKNLTIGVVAENPISFAGDSSRPFVNTLSLTPTLTYNLPHGWFVGYSDFDLSFDWTSGGAATIPLGVQAGKIFRIGKLPVCISLEAAWVPVRPDDTPKWLVCLELTVIYKTFRGRH
jgi:hypothetical protein